MYKKINNKGFTLIEVLITIAILSFVTITFFAIVSNTFSITDDKAYEVFKKSIVNQVNDYIIECDNSLIDCKGDYIWQTSENVQKASFSLNVMKKYSYFSEEDYINPITNKDISNCLIINVIKDEYSSLEISLDDSTCEK